VVMMKDVRPAHDDAYEYDFLKQFLATTKGRIENFVPPHG